MYLERYSTDGDMWSFVKSINDDYIRYERTIKTTIEREEKMAKTFVEKVRHTIPTVLKNPPCLSFSTSPLRSHAIIGHQHKRWGSLFGMGEVHQFHP